MSGSYELYAEVLRRAAVKVAGEIGWELEPSRAQFLPDSVARWLPFRESNAAMDRLGKRYDVGIVSNIDDKLLGVSRRHLRTELDLVVTAQQVRSYKPDPAHFKEGARRIGGKKGWVHIASRLRHRRRAAAEDERAGDLGQPPRREARGPQEARRGGRATSATRRRSSVPAAEPGGRPTRRSTDPADDAMVARARERFAAERRHLDRRRRQAEREGALPNLIVIGGLKCGTTSLHHYLNLHPADRDVASEGAQLLRRRAQLGARARTGTRATSTARRPSAARPRRTTRTCRASPASPSGCGTVWAPRRGSSTWSATRSTGCSPTTSTTWAAAMSRGRWRRPSPTRTRPTSPAAATRCRSSPISRPSAPSGC